MRGKSDRKSCLGKDSSRFFDLFFFGMVVLAFLGWYLVVLYCWILPGYYPFRILDGVGFFLGIILSGFWMVSFLMVSSVLILFEWDWMDVMV